MLFNGKQELKILQVRILWPKRKLNDEDVGREIQISLAAGPSILEAEGGRPPGWTCGPARSLRLLHEKGPKTPREPGEPQVRERG